MTFNDVMDVLVPLTLLAIAGGFIYTKFIKPWVVPHIRDWLDSRNSNVTIKREIIYE